MAGILVFQALGTLDIAFKTLAATISGFVLYVIFVKAMRLIKHVQLFKLKSTLFYSVAIIASSIWTIVTLININATVLTNSTTQWRSFVAENISQNSQNLTTQINQQFQNFQSTPSTSGLIVT